MNTFAVSDFARRLASHPRWEWRAGMLAVAPRPYPLDDVISRCDGGRGWAAYPGSIPDLIDPATAGVLLAMLDEAVEHANIETERTTPDQTSEPCCDWTVRVCQWNGADWDSLHIETAPTLGEACARALIEVWHE